MTPIKRQNALQPISHDHHLALLVSWKIRMGIRKSIEVQRIKRFCDFFYESHLYAHFTIEEEYIFPILGQQHELIVKALTDHHRLRALFEQKTPDLNILARIEKELEEHIRFEERVLFNEIQKVATEAQFSRLAAVHAGAEVAIKNIENWYDEFWI